MFHELPTPFLIMDAVNVLAGMFSAFAGFRKTRSLRLPLGSIVTASAGNPWLYVFGGAITALIGCGNFGAWNLATWGTIGFIATSADDGLFGAGRKDFRFDTLTAYTLVQTAMVVWSTTFRPLG